MLSAVSSVVTYSVCLQSDHPVLDSRFLMYEAQQAFYYGLPHHLALASVTSNPARVLGMDHRIGHVREGALRLRRRYTHHGLTSSQDMMPVRAACRVYLARLK